MYFSSIEKAMDLVRGTKTIVTAMAASEPKMFYQQAEKHLPNLENSVLYCSNPSQPYPIFGDDSLLGRVEFRPMFLTASIKNHRNKPHVHYVPQHLSQWAVNILKSDVDIFWGSCSQPNSRGFVSLGPSVCYEWEVLRKAKVVVLEMNPHIPFTFGSTLLHVSRADFLLESQAELPSCKGESYHAEDRKIAEYVGELVPDESTIQLGIGSIPNALADVLSTKKNLGVHTEMINDAIYRLAEKGVITGGHKSMWPEKMVGAFAYGSKELYQFIHNNPAVELHPASIVNDITRIGRNFQMISINSAIEVDITGQVCSESIGHLEVTGVGGAADTHIGAQKSEKGRGIIALRSRAKGDQPKIVAELQPGAKVSISRNDVDTVITEFGIAELKGKSVAERARRLIDISHPEDRPRLRERAKEVGYL